MAKLVSATCALLLLLVETPGNNPLAKYRAVEAYEVRPGILAFPRYAEDGRVCEVGLEGRHYSPEKIALDSTLSRLEIDAIVDELAPADKRGPRSAGPLDGLNTITGHAMRQIEDYENVTLQIDSVWLAGNPEKNAIVDDIVVAIKWKNRLCK
jgi:hypothetical protein